MLGFSVQGLPGDLFWAYGTASGLVTCCHQVGACAQAASLKARLSRAVPRRCMAWACTLHSQCQPELACSSAQGSAASQSRVWRCFPLDQACWRQPLAGASVSWDSTGWPPSVHCLLAAYSLSHSQPPVPGRYTADAGTDAEPKLDQAADAELQSPVVALAWTQDCAGLLAVDRQGHVRPVLVQAGPSMWSEHRHVQVTLFGYQAAPAEAGLAARGSLQALWSTAGLELALAAQSVLACAGASMQCPVAFGLRGQRQVCVKAAPRSGALPAAPYTA